MPPSSVEQRVKSVIARHLELEDSQLTRDMRFRKDLALYSIDFVGLVIAIEDEFSAELQGRFPAAEAAKLESIGHAIDYVEAKVAAAAVR